MKGWFQRDLHSPFVRLTPAERFLAVILLCSCGLFVMPFALESGEPEPVLLYGSFLVYLGALALPFAWCWFSF